MITLCLILFAGFWLNQQKYPSLTKILSRPTWNVMFWMAMLSPLFFWDYSLNQEKYPSLTKLVSSQDVLIKINLECHFLDDYASLPPFLRYVDKFNFSLVLSPCTMIFNTFIVYETMLWRLFNFSKPHAVQSLITSIIVQL